MGESPVPDFGHVDLEVEDAHDASPGGEAFGHVDIDVGEAGDPPHDSADSAPPRSRSFGRGDPLKRITRKADRSTAPPPSIHDESTRIVKGDLLSHMTRPQPPHDEPTSAWVDVALEEPASEGPSSSYPGQPAPSESGVATRGDQVAAMRELYAKGDAEGALALAAALDPVVREVGSDHPDASIVVTFGEEEISDPYGGLIPADDLVDDELAAKPTAPPPSTRSPSFASLPPPPSTRTPSQLAMTAPLASARSLSHHVKSAPPPSTRTPSAAPSTAGSEPPAAKPSVAAQLTLTARQSIPRVLKSPAEIAELPIDHRAGFLLAHFDGVQTIEEILDICAMPGDEAIQLITELVAMGVVDLE